MALYRKYRPASFAEVVGQEQVTRPLSTALDTGRINHAYLFSGPRGCGKTSSARILARSLNCVEGPTSTPCGVCPSCVSLAPGGHGNLDVTELDAASHRGVDDMRELRDRAYFAPAESRYRVFIIDEAHMITIEGANALLKIVEEPPEHLIFIFATTEPEKIIGTIRSRTHHYPFRLLTPQSMRQLLERTVESEDVRVDDDVYPLIIRSGGGSPRDTLSLLDQLLAGSGPDGLTYDEALPLLGVTDLGLIDDTVNALAAGDGAGAFQAVDDVIEAGHEPRRFALDLLDRLRDLMVIQAVPDAFGQGLVEAPTDRAQVLADQAAQFTGPRLAQLASEINDRISSLRGATSPRLLLEIMVAHLLAVPATSSVQAAQPVQAQSAGRAVPGGTGEGVSPQTVQQDTPAQRGGAAAAAQAAAAAAAGRTKSSSTPAPRQAPRPEPAPKPEPAHHADSSEELFATIKETWTHLRQYVGGRNKVAEIMLTEARPLGVKDQTLIIGHNTGALAQRINSERNKADIVAAFSEKLGTQVSVKCVVGTDPVAAGFHHVDKQPEVWNPQAQQHNATAENQSTEPEPESEPEPEPAPAGEAQTTPTPDEVKAPSTPEQPQETAQAGWGAPARIPGQQAGGDESASAEPVAVAQPQTARSPQPQSSDAHDWKSIAREATHRAGQRQKRERDEIPLPPEPVDDDAPPPPDRFDSRPAQDSDHFEPAGAPAVQTPSQAPVPEQPYSREDEEQAMADQAQEPGVIDRRDATQVAMELLQKELGAKPL